MMNRHIKKMLCGIISTSLIAANIIMPAVVKADAVPIFEGDTVIKEWKFDFGSGDDVAPGYTAVTPDRNYVTAKDYGFLGIDGEGFKLGDRLDSFGNQKGQKIELAAGGGTGLNDAVGSVGEDMFGNTGEKYYPTRFALKVEDETYYRVKATVTTLDPTKDAEVSLYTERKHPIITDAVIKAGDTRTLVFSVRPTPIYYEKSEPKGSIPDGMVNVCVLGENSAIAALEIQQVETLPVFWVLGDSTVTDGNCALPFFRLQNYTGVGTGLTKYLPPKYAMVNEGEGGLNAADSLHFNMVSSRIKKGDYLYVEYGQNHKSDGETGYLSCLDKYYTLCHGKEANLIIVSPIERINQWDSTTKQYTHSLAGFAAAGEKYVADKVKAGATDIAYVDLNTYSLNFYNKIVKDNGDSADAIKFYFQTLNGATDQTHPNDAGAENLAYEFFKAAKAVDDATQKAVLADIVDNMTDELPNLVPDSITEGGLRNNPAWPIYVVPTDNEYPVVINDIKFDESGKPVQADVTVQDAKINMEAYGIIVITVFDEDGVEKGKFYAMDQVDNSTGKGKQTIKNFRGDVTLGENDTYTAIVMKAEDTAEGLQVSEDEVAYSATYKPTDIAFHLITNEDNDGNEDFDYYGAEYDDKSSSLEGFNNWTKRGSAGITLTLGQDGETKYATISSDGAKNGAAGQGSCYVAKDLTEPIGTTGRYLISADMKFVSSTGMNVKFVVGNTDKDPWGSETFTAFSIGGEGAVTIDGEKAGNISATGFTNVKYILDMDLGTASLSVGGGDEVTVNVPNYTTTELNISPERLTGFMFESNKTMFDIKVANLVVAKLKDVKLPEREIKIAPNNTTIGTVELFTPEPEPTPEPLPEPTPVSTKEPDAASTKEPEAASTKEPEAVSTKEPEAVSTKAPEQGTVPDPSDSSGESNADDATLTGDETSGGVTLSYANGNAVITSDNGSLTAVLIEAVYADDGTSLSEVKINKVEYKDGDDKTKTVAVSEGSKIMLWDSLKNVKALCGAVECITPAEPTPEITLPPEPTPTPESTSAPEPTPMQDLPGTIADSFKINSVITIKATPEEGYVFLGWIDRLTNTKVSGDAEYKFRLHYNENLMAQFAKEPSLEDVVNFSVSPEQASMKGKPGVSVKVNAGNAFDAANTPFTKLTNTDITWSCDTAGITVSADGVVTVGDDFALPEGKLTTDIKITGTLNGIEKTCSITVYGYEYFENMDESTTNFNGTFVTVAGKTMMAFPGGNATSSYSMSEPVSLDKATTLLFDHAWSGSNTCGQLRRLHFKNSEGQVIFSMHYTWDTLVVGGTDILKAVQKDAFSTVKVEIDPVENKVKVTVGEKSAEITLLENAGDIAGIDFVSDSSVPGPEARALGISNITIVQ
ncbi:MAG: hypothetical protein J1F64_00355 [Oscillospiraceae bacterium]|nr:hypothetical protein [Oscillospiraceae bacterium]